MLALREAQDDLLVFNRLIMPDVDDPDDVLKSRFEITPLARLLCQVIQRAVRGEGKRRIAVSVGPQMGKSQILSRAGPAWVQGRLPHANQILGSYNQPMASEFGDSVREIMNSPTYRQIFPDTVLRREQVDWLITTAGGRLAFVGRGGSGTGKPADFFWVDDPIKDNIEAQSDSTREETWNWFSRVAMTRAHSKSIIVVIHTRWNSDDLIGRLCDPEHPERSKSLRGIEKYWDYFCLPAVVDDPKLAKALGLELQIPENPEVRSAFGTKPMSSLWPGRKSLEFLAEAKIMDASGFSALYMGRPTSEEGEFFKADWLLEYDEGDLPKDLVKYGASDHAVSVKQGKDYTVIGCVGVDANDDIWVLPDLVWERMQTDRTVEELISHMEMHRPACWWLEEELISKAFGPFLYKRMMEKKVYTLIDTIVPSKDKRTQARSIQGRMQMRKVRFPRFAHWWKDARAQLLKFDSAAYDDFVSFLSLIGLGLFKQYIPDEHKDETTEDDLKSGSIQWILRNTEARAMHEKRARATAGW